jgi:hypothetical protein
MLKTVASNIEYMILSSTANEPWYHMLFSFLIFCIVNILVYTCVKINERGALSVEELAFSERKVATPEGILYDKI